ncbi:MAG: 1-acyl-sn-glycerol-3-phosphate acyltransferase [Planctomycetales bacterium]|nr:1-acyl-sn-glycerol-3-phosphate acyltransferase [Planctomycetales bacterium]
MPRSTTQPSLLNNLFYGTLKLFFGVLSAIMFRLKISGREYEPATGGALLMSNHESFLDPVYVGVAFRRRPTYLARASLFRNAAFGRIISAVGAIPIDRDGSGISGLKETLRRLKRGEMVLIFPEGTRSPDGRVQPLKPGFVALARRADVPLVPVAIAGAYDAWPRQRRLPRPGRVCVEIGAPIAPDTIAGWSDEELIAQLQTRIEACHAAAQQRRGVRADKA